MENMEKINDFESFYATRLQPFLTDLSLKSNETNMWFYSGIASLIIAISFFILAKILIAILLLIFVIISIYMYTKTKEEYIDKYKQTIINEIINYLNPGTEYAPSKTISSKDYKKSGLFRHFYDYYSGSDFLKGIYKNVQFYSSELDIQYDGGATGNVQETIFRGLFFAAPLNTYFTGGTYIWPRNDIQLATSIMEENYRLMPLPEVYKLNTQHTNFENYFSAYSTNPLEARIIINDEFLDRMVNFKKQINRSIRFSVVSGVCYVAISINEDLLEPSISDPANKENIKQYFFSVLLILSIINQLNLPRLL